MILFTFNTILIQSKSKRCVQFWRWWKYESTGRLLAPPCGDHLRIFTASLEKHQWPDHSSFSNQLLASRVYVCERWTGEKNDDKSTSKDPGLKYEISNISLQKLFSQLYSIGDVNWRIYNKLLLYKWFLTLNNDGGEICFQLKND